jgi:DNA-3-methyladenine glycosylase I
MQCLDARCRGSCSAGSTVRNRAKVESAIGNARALLLVRQEFESFDTDLWPFVGGKPVDHRLRRPQDV